MKLKLYDKAGELVRTIKWPELPPRFYLPSNSGEVSYLRVLGSETKKSADYKEEAK